jgi:hypothetical protein
MHYLPTVVMLENVAHARSMVVASRRDAPEENYTRPSSWFSALGISWLLLPQAFPNLWRDECPDTDVKWDKSLEARLP